MSNAVLSLVNETFLCLFEDLTLARVGFSFVTLNRYVGRHKDHRWTIPGNLEDKIPQELSMEPWTSELRCQPPKTIFFYFFWFTLLFVQHQATMCWIPKSSQYTASLPHPSQLVGKPLLCGTTSDPGGSWCVWEREVEHGAWSNSWVAASQSWSCLLALLCSCEKRHFHPHWAKGSGFVISQWPHYFPDYIWLLERWAHGTLSMGLIISILQTVIYGILTFFDLVFTLGKAKNIVIVIFWKHLSQIKAKCWLMLCVLENQALVH